MYFIKDVLFNNQKLKNSGYTYQFDSENYKSDIKKWCTINMWWGRRNREYEVEVI